MNVIVASSNVFRRELSSYILSEAGYTVHEASDSLTLLRYLDTFQPAFMLLDSLLNGIPSRELIITIRSRSVIPILSLVSRPIHNGLDLSFDGSDAEAIVWPYQPEDLLARVQSLLHHHQRAHKAASREYGNPHHDIEGTLHTA